MSEWMSEGVNSESKDGSIDRWMEEQINGWTD